MEIEGVTFGEKHSYRDWGLYLKSRPVVSPPAPKTVYVDIPGSDGVIDLTESLTGETAYENRNMSFEFMIKGSREKWPSIYSDIMDYMHGQRMKIVLDEDPAYYYIGRVTAGNWESPNEAISSFTVSADVEPYKYERFGSLEDWEWDPFDFEDGIIREYGDIAVDGSLTFIIEARRKPVTPAFTVVSEDGSGMKVEYKNATYSLQDGTSRVLNITLEEGENTLVFTGNGTVSIDYRGGRL